MTLPPDRAAEAGFTLIEMIVVLAIMGAMIGLVVARGPQHSASLDLRVVTADMARAMRGARARAIATDRPVTFTLDVVGHIYHVGEAAPVQLPSAFGLALRSAAGEARGAGRGGISFAPDGSSTGGAIDIISGLRHVRIDVGWLTGRVSVADGA